MNAVDLLSKEWDRTPVSRERDEPSLIVQITYRLICYLFRALLFVFVRH